MMGLPYQWGDGRDKYGFRVISGITQTNKPGHKNNNNNKKTTSYSAFWGQGEGAGPFLMKKKLGKSWVKKYWIRTIRGEAAENFSKLIPNFVVLKKVLGRGGVGTSPQGS
jgi:hypothetical protein